MINVRVLDTTRRADVAAWVQLPYKLYAGDPYWVPEMMDDARQTLNRQKNPFFLHSYADFLLAEKDGKPVGRIAVLDNSRYNNLRKEHTAFFTLFESIDDFAVAEALFNTAFDWARQRGLDKIIGPKGFLTMDGMGMLVEGFNHRPAIGITYNPDYYHDFVKRLGFERETDFMSGHLSSDYKIPERVLRIAEKVKQRYGFTVRNFKTKAELAAVVPKVIDAYNLTFTNNWEYVPITREEGEVIAKRVLQIAIPEQLKLVWKEDTIVGFLICYPDISAAIQRSGGKLLPFGWYYLLREFKRTKWINLNGIGILPQYRGRGVDAMMLAEAAKTMSEGNYEHAEVVQIDEGNTKMQAEMTALGVNFYKRHRIFHRAL